MLMFFRFLQLMLMLPLMADAATLIDCHFTLMLPLAADA